SWYRRRIGSHLDWSFQVSPRRFRNGMRQLVEITRSDLRPLVLVMTIAPPPPLLAASVPSQAARVRRYNDLLREVVAGFDDPDVVLVDVAPAIEALGGV